MSSYTQSRKHNVEQRIILVKQEIQEVKTYINNLNNLNNLRRNNLVDVRFLCKREQIVLLKLNSKLKELEKRQELLNKNSYIMEKIYSTAMVVKNCKIKIPTSLSCMFVVLTNHN